MHLELLTSTFVMGLVGWLGWIDWKSFSHQCSAGINFGF